MGPFQMAVSNRFTPMLHPGRVETSWLPHRKKEATQILWIVGLLLVVLGAIRGHWISPSKVDQSTGGLPLKLPLLEVPKREMEETLSHVSQFEGIRNISEFKITTVKPLWLLLGLVVGPPVNHPNLCRFLSIHSWYPGYMTREITKRNLQIAGPLERLEFRSYIFVLYMSRFAVC